MPFGAVPGTGLGPAPPLDHARRTHRRGPTIAREAAPSGAALTPPGIMVTVGNVECSRYPARGQTATSAGLQP
jgi:hypothetical protein